MAFSNHKLRKIIKQKIKEEHRELIPGRLFWLQTYLNYISRRQSWWLVILHVLVLFALFTFIRFEYFTWIAFDAKTPDILIDQRASNVATIVSMTMAIMGLLLTNMAIKDSQTYKMLFVKSRLYLILYYSLCVIFYLITISSLRDTLNTDFYYRAVLTGTYLSLGILFGIGYLFRRIIHFANPSKIQSILTTELIDEAKSNLQITLLSKYSKSVFLETMKEANVNEYTLTRAFGFGKVGSIEEVTEVPAPVEKKLVYDIDIKRLKKQLALDQTKTPKFYTELLAINGLVENFDGFVYPNIGKSVDKGMKLSKCLTLRPVTKQVIHGTEFLGYFDKKLEDYAEEGKFRKVAEILAVYDNLYTLHMRHE